MTTGEHIRSLRREHGMKQWELADLVGCSKQVISNIERGETEVSAGMAARCAEVFHVTVDNLTVNNQPRVVRLTPNEMELIRIYRNADPKGQAFLRSVFTNYETSRS